MMAQGFQESSFDQNAKSSVGAIGIMQLMPATGEQMKVGDIHQEEANIHAGVKNIRFMVDKYFANEPMTDTNKVLFALLPTTRDRGAFIRYAKKLQKKGLDLNVWTGNVNVRDVGDGLHPESELPQLVLRKGRIETCDLRPAARLPDGQWG